MSVPHTSTHIVKYEDFKDGEEPVTQKSIREISRPCQRILNKNDSNDPSKWTYYPEIYDMDALRLWVRSALGQGRDYNREFLDWSEWDNVEWDDKTDGPPIGDVGDTFTFLRGYQQERRIRSYQSSIDNNDFVRTSVEALGNFIPRDIDDLVKAVKYFIRKGEGLRNIITNYNARNLRLLEVILHFYDQGIHKGHVWGFSEEEHIFLFATLRHDLIPRWNESSSREMKERIDALKTRIMGIETTLEGVQLIENERRSLIADGFGEQLIIDFQIQTLQALHRVSSRIRAATERRSREDSPFTLS